MSVSKRLLEDPTNLHVSDNNDPGAYDKSFAGTPGQHHEQQCCDNHQPYWDTYRIEGDGPTAGQRLNLESDPYGLPSGGDPYPIHATSPLQDGDLLIEGPYSGYRPVFVSPSDWMLWQGLVWKDAYVDH